MPQNQQNQQNRFNIITDLVNPKLSGLLTGSGLMLLDRCVPGIFSQLVREAIWWFKKADKVDWEIARLKNIECLLGRVTERDLLDYIPLEYSASDKRPDDPRALLVPFPTRSPNDTQRTLLIEVIRADYQFLIEKMTQDVLFKIERTDYDPRSPSSEFTLNESRVIWLMLCSPRLLRKLDRDGIVKILFVLFSLNEVIRSHPALWPFLTFDVINERFLKDTNITSCEAEFILSNEVILKSLTNVQILSIAHYLDPKSIKSVLDSPAFRARLEEDKAQNHDRENKLLMQLAELPKKKTGGFSFSFAPTIAENSFTRGLLSHAESRALLFDPKFKDCQASIMSSLLQREDFIYTLSSAELLKTVTARTECCVAVARSYLARFSVEDLIDFTDSCVLYITGNGRVELNIIFETLPTELAKRAEELTSTQWLTFARMHPQIGLFIVDRYPSKLESSQLESLSRGYKDNTELLQKITRLIETRDQEKRKREAELLARQEQQKQSEKQQLEERRAQEEERKRQQMEEIKRRQEGQKRLESFGAPSQNPQPQTVQKQGQLKGYKPSKSSSTLQEKTPWAHYFRLAFFTTLGLVGFALFLLGIGSAVGIPVIVTMTSTLFSFLPWSAALTSFVGGYLVYIAAAITAAISFKQDPEMSNQSIPEKTTPSKKSSCSTANIFRWLGCCPQLSQTQDVPHDVALSQVSIKPSTTTPGVGSNPTLTRHSQDEKDESRKFGF